MKPAEKGTAAPHSHRETAAHAPSRNRTENLLIKSQTRRETHADSRATTEDGGEGSDPDPDTYRRAAARSSHDRSHDAPAFVRTRGDAWLRSLPNRAPKDSPTYRRWYAANEEGRRTARPATFAPRVCRHCAAPYTPRRANQKDCPACIAARHDAAARSARTVAA